MTDPQPPTYPLIARIAAALASAHLDAVLRVIDEEVTRRVQLEVNEIRTQMQAEADQRVDDVARECRRQGDAWDRQRERLLAELQQLREGAP